MLIPCSQDWNNVEREIETIEGEISGCRPRDDELANVIASHRPPSGCVSRMLIALLMFDAATRASLV